MAFLDDACAAVKRWLSLLGITDRVQVKVGKLEPHVCASTWTKPRLSSRRSSSSTTPLSAARTT